MDARGGTPMTPHHSSWGTRLRRRRTRPPRRFVFASVGLHAAFVALLFLSGFRIRPAIEYEQFRVTLVSPPPQVAAPEPEPVVTTTPVVEVEPPPPQPTPTPPQPQRTQAPVQEETQRQPDPEPAKGPDPTPTPVGGENMQVVQDGREFEYPEYLENIMLQLFRHFRWTGPDREAEVVFYINRDGSVGGIRVVRSSRDFQFDMKAVEALEAVSRARAFGPLPEGWQRERLYISYTFQPPR